MEKFRILIIFVFLFFVSKKTVGQTFEFDSARFSSDGKYALILEGNSLNGCNLFYWTLYESGLNRKLEPFVVIEKELVYILTYDENKKSDIFQLNQNGTVYKWFITKKYTLGEFIAKYDLLLKPINQTYNLKVKLDTLPNTWRIIATANQFNLKDSSNLPNYLIKLTFIYNQKIIVSDTISYLPEPGIRSSHAEFLNYIKELENQTQRTKEYAKDFGKRFYIYDNTYLLSFKVNTEIFTGREDIGDGTAFTWGILYDKNGDFNLFR